MTGKSKTKKGVIVAKVSANGQISLPLGFRKELGIEDYVSLCVQGNTIVLKKLEFWNLLDIILFRKEGSVVGKKNYYIVRTYSDGSG